MKSSAGSPPVLIGFVVDQESLASPVAPVSPRGDTTADASASAAVVQGVVAQQTHGHSAGALVTVDLAGNRNMHALPLNVGILVGLVVLVILIVRHSEDAVRFFGKVGKDMHDRRDHMEIVFLAVAIQIVVTAMPNPVHTLWRVMVGFVYGMPGFFILMLGHFFGCLLGFCGARLAWRSGLSECCGCCTICSRACFSKSDRPNKLMLVVQGSKLALEDRPFRMILLLGLAPIPWTATCYVLGARADRVSALQFIVPMTLAGVKQLPSLYAGSRMSDLESTISGKRDSKAELATTLFSVIAGILLVAVVAKLAWRSVLNAMEAEASEGDPGDTVAQRASSIAEVGGATPPGGQQSPRLLDL